MNLPKSKSYSKVNVIGDETGVSFSETLIFHVFHAKPNDGSKLSFYFFMRLFLLDRLPRYNVKLFDASSDKQLLKKKTDWLLDYFFKCFAKMQKSCAGNSRLFIRAQ